METISLIIAIAGFILSAAQWIYTFYCNRTKFSIAIEKSEFYKRSNYNRCILTFTIQNLSDAPLSITRMYLEDTPCLISHQWIGERYYPKFPESDIPSTERILSEDFPINIPPHGGGIYRVVFDFSDKTFCLGSLVSINVITTHKPKTFCLYCPHQPHTLSF